MTRLTVIPASDAGAWRDVLAGTKAHDTYHLPEYHAVAEASEEGCGYLFAYQDGPYTIALPLLLRGIEGIPGLPAECAHSLDATSVYGYAGPICSHDVVPVSVVHDFQKELHDALRERHVVSAFSRLHPLLCQDALLAGLGDCPVRWQTVSIDLTLPLDVQRSRYRKNHREGVSKLIRKGLVFVHDMDWRYFDVFREIYYETMRHVEAAPSYFFSAQYFARLREALGGQVQLFAVLHEDRVVCAALMFEHQGILQYHLSGTRDSARKLAPMKLLLDGVREWGARRGLRVFHLGGGMTARPDDPLFHFKLGFSGRTHNFAVWRWIILPDAFRTLCEARAEWNHQHDLCETAADYFPQYRCPAGPRLHSDDNAAAGRAASKPRPEWTGAPS